jgi:hypothetical protein
MVGNLSILQAQDTIVKRDNERIVCKIKEISTDQIKCLFLNNGKEILWSIDKNDVIKVILSNGAVMNFSNSMYKPENYEGQRKNCIKLQVLTPIYGYTTISYEHSLKPGSSIEGTVAIIGLGDQRVLKFLGNGGSSFSELPSRGLTFKLGYKYISTKGSYGIRNDHLLKGFYLRPEIAASFYKRYNIYIPEIRQNDNENYSSVAILFNVGKQWIFSNFVALDIFAGLGYGYSSDNSFSLRYGFTTGNNDIAYSTGFRLGILF